MKKIEDLKWGEIRLERLFDICSTKSSIDRNRLTGQKGAFPYITRTDKDNGVDDFIDQQPSYDTDEGNVITIGLDTQTVFYQPSEFFTGQNIQVLRNIHLNKYVALFLVPLIKIQMVKFNWGGNGATLGRLKKVTLKLPIIENEVPDYEFMEEYMKQIEYKLLSRYKTYLEKKPKINKVKLSASTSWINTEIENECTVLPGVRLTVSDMIPGIRPFIGATESMNGITQFVDNINKSLDKNVLGVNYNGSVGYGFYHQYEALFSDDVKRLHFKKTDGDKYSYLFLATSIRKQSGKFQYGYKMNAERMRKQSIMLPVDKKKGVDYIYMKGYMHKVESKLLSRYINNRISHLDNDNIQHR